MNDKVDLLVGEDIFFFNHVNQGQTTTFKNVCFENDRKWRPEKISLKVNYILNFSQPSNTVKNLENIIKCWIANEKYVPCNKHNCHSTRKYCSRQYVSGSVPRYFGLELSLWPCAANLPVTLTVTGNIYQLRASTYGNSHHFNASLSFKGRLYSYDGLGGYHSPETGIKRLPKPQIPMHYYRNYCFYVLRSTVI